MLSTLSYRPVSLMEDDNCMIFKRYSFIHSERSELTSHDDIWEGRENCKGNDTEMGACLLEYV